MLIKKFFIVLLFFSINLFSKNIYKEKLIGNNSKLPTVAIIITGGTISETTDPST